MKRFIYNLLIEPIGSTYCNLLDYASNECEFFLLVTDVDQEYLSLNGKITLIELTPYIYRAEMKSEWPGTSLLNGEIPVYIYRFNPESIAILKKVQIGYINGRTPYFRMIFAY